MTVKTNLHPRLRLRRQLRVSNAQSWSDFKLHWPMEVLHLLRDIGGGFLFGFAFALALFLYLLHESVAV